MHVCRTDGFISFVHNLKRIQFIVSKKENNAIIGLSSKIVTWDEHTAKPPLPPPKRGVYVPKPRRSSKLGLAASRSNLTSITWPGAPPFPRASRTTVNPSSHTHKQQLDEA